MKKIIKQSRQKITTNSLTQHIPLPPTQRPLIIKTHLLLDKLKEKIYAIINLKFKKRTNLLSKKDILKIYLLAKKGDIFLVGNLKEIGNIFVPGAFTHTALYLGKGKIIHSTIDYNNTTQGVQYTTLKHYVKTYDTFAIIRLPRQTKHRRHIIKNALNFAKQQLGKPYESFFSKQKKHTFCTQLVNDAYTHAGHNTKLKSIHPFRTTLGKIEKNILNVTHWLKPIEFMHSNFRLIFLSHNLSYNGKEIFLRSDKLPKNL